MKNLINAPSLIFFLIFLTLFLYAPVLDNDFATRDDAWMLYENPDVRSLNFSTIQHTFLTIYNGQYSPINTLYYALVYDLFGPAPICLQSPIGIHTPHQCTFGFLYPWKDTETEFSFFWRAENATIKHTSDILFDRSDLRRSPPTG